MYVCNLCMYIVCMYVHVLSYNVESGLAIWNFPGARAVLETAAGSCGTSYDRNFKVIWETYLKTPGTVTEPAEAQAFVGTTNDWSGWFMRQVATIRKATRAKKRAAPTSEVGSSQKKRAVECTIAGSGK